jgi:hypothetical protein
MNIPAIRKDDPSALQDELIRELAERARIQRLRHQLERARRQSRHRSAGDGSAETPAVISGLRKPALIR